MIKKILGSLAGQLFIALAGLAVISACSMGSLGSTGGQQPLNKTTWVLKSIDGKPIAIKNNPQQPTLSFEDGRMGGFSGCNRLFGNYASSQDGTFALGQVGMTRMACAGEANDLEQQVVDRLNKASIYALSPSQLNLLGADRKPLLTYTQTAARP